MCEKKELGIECVIKYFEENSIAKVDLLDLKEFDFPLFNERLMYQSNPSEKLLNFSERVRKQNGIIRSFWLYNDSFLLHWRMQSCSLSRVSKCCYFLLVHCNLGRLAYNLPTWKHPSQMKAIVSPVKFFATNIANEYTEEGNAVNKEKYWKRVKPMVDCFTFLVDKFSN